MKKLLIFFPLFLFSYYYPFNYQFTFIHNCMLNSPIKNKYNYCRCVYEKIKTTYPYNYFIYHQLDRDVLNKIVLFSKECLK